MDGWIVGFGVVVHGAAALFTCNLRARWWCVDVAVAVRVRYCLSVCLSVHALPPLWRHFIVQILEESTR